MAAWTLYQPYPHIELTQGLQHLLMQGHSREVYYQLILSLCEYQRSSPAKRATI